jgi:hypothetical protein
MAYSANVEGYLTIDPPLEWKDIRESKFYAEGGTEVFPDVKFKVDQQYEETERGHNTVITATYVIPYKSFDFACRTLTEDCMVLFEEMKGVGRALTGELIVQPTHYGDGWPWRVRVDERGAHEEHAKLQWPDGSEVPSA